MGGPLKKYEVTTPSGVKTTMKLNGDDAKRLGVTADSPADEPAAELESDAEQAPVKSRATRNKARTATGDKDGGTGGGD
ncbi:hypothetical protein ACIRD2_03050 [Streptomyces sp. NPDC093595]|uniref:hypothetical protein n=1 Tax=Streptomyces sp. NPDC093595 TaxID=3366045 RepID=UPI00381D53B2